MKHAKRIVSLMLVVVMMCLMQVTTAFAAEVTQDGLTVTLTTDKEAYAADEQIVATLTVTNTGTTLIANVSMEDLIPEGYQFAEGSLGYKQIDVLAAGETETLVVTLVKIKEEAPATTAAPANNNTTNTSANDTGSPKTGDGGNLGLWIVLGGGAALVTVALGCKKKRNAMLSLLLCVSMVGTTVAGVVPVKSGATGSEITTKTITLTQTVKAGGKDIDLTAKVEFQTAEDIANSFMLRPDNNIIFIGEDADVRLYLETTLSVESITLWYGTEGNLTNSIEMYDNGVGIDDIEGDGVYSASVNPGATADSIIYYVAKYDTISSNEVGVKYYIPISDEAFDAMEIVDQGIDELLANPDYIAMTEEEKVEAIKSMLTGFEEQGYIMAGSIAVDEANKIVTFMYLEEILGGVMYGEFDTDKNGLPEEAEDVLDAEEENTDDENDVTEDASVEEDTDAAAEEAPEETEAAEEAEAEEVNAEAADEEITEAAPEEAEAPVEEAPAEEVPVEEAAPVKNVQMNLTMPVGSGAGDEIGKAVILNSFPIFETEEADIAYRTGFYEQLDTLWDNAGLTTTLIVNPTVADYKNLADYNVICISTHGSRYSWRDGFLWQNYHEYSAICLAEDRSWAKNKEYKSELKDKQIAKVNGSYWILPSFFTMQYDASAFSDSFVFSECCMALGQGQGDNAAAYDYAMPNAITGRSAKAYIGFHNSVFADYSRQSMEEYVNCLINGMTSQQAFDSVITTMGANHEIWFNNVHTYTLQDYTENLKKHPEPYNPLVHIAYPIRSGSDTAVLVNAGIVNGGFEDYSELTTAPKSWDLIGDVRTLTKLGDIKPYGSASNRMAIVTSGIGAQDSAQFENGTEGSKLSQTFIVPTNANKIVFNYNFVSEEPMEYVGSSFDDSFVVQIAQNGALQYNEIYESINSSVWKPVNGVNFIGGDDTAFQTGWKTGEIDVTAYRGMKITLSFIIVDVGDTLYDSACLVDNVAIQ